jgi:tRNA threonylcarbamoyl adenosine modification protein (Sua5/YciO/YrdC/YwlC family)
MSQYLQIHPENPQLRLIRRAAEILRDGGVIVYPTDSCYALGCTIGNKDAMHRIRRIRNAGKDHTFTLVCRDLSEISTYARVDNAAYRLLRAHTPGPYTFILEATREVPKRLQDPSRRTIGIRIPDHVVAASLLGDLGAPIMSSTLILAGDELPLSDPRDIRARLEQQVDAIIDSGTGGLVPTTVVDLVGDTPRVVREGKGPIAGLEASPQSI